MLSSLLRPKKKSRRVLERFPSSPPYAPYAEQSTSAGIEQGTAQARHATADWTETDNDEETEEENTNDSAIYEEEVDNIDRGQHEEDHEDGDEATPLLPIFSAAHLDALPVYNITHVIRLIVLPRSETTLTWEQLRSPQVSQFLVKPMQQRIRTSHFSRATLYALMANCLQFGKEGQMNPGSAGSSRTRAMVCELLAIKLLKEYNTRELIDALSYDFYPLQGLRTPDPAAATGSRPAAARTSTLEVAIRAQAKRFLAHPVVVQHLEALWAGTIVFHSAADDLHRPQLVVRPSKDRGYGGIGQRSPEMGESLGKLGPAMQVKQRNTWPTQTFTRRRVSLYDPRDASLFKLSRLRVPRYRQFFSTVSLAILLGLYLAVLSQRSLRITALEVVFWFWSAGFMLDEVVGFSVEGFALYMLSFWNTFDLGILLLLIIYYCMRLYSVFLVGAEGRHWNSMAYDVLAANAVLLFPRLFSALDHIRYFSQLLIAFRLMSLDLAAVFVLIIISCSGFFVAFTLSFSNGEYGAADIAYGLFQLILGFTPAAWGLWPTFNILGKAILTLFLFICHFLILTILISVLTNSFMAIASNANEEHQFVFAVNTISMVKNDALFSYVAPGNILAWFLTPLRYLMPFRQFVKMNRYVIKFTHFPLLLCILGYEKLFLAHSVYEPTDLIDNKGRVRQRAISFMEPERVGLFSPSIRMRQESLSGFQKDKALDEVFRLAPRNGQRSKMKSQERRQTSNVVNSWMDQQEGMASPPPEQDRSIVDRLERKRQESRQAALIRRDRLRRQMSGTRSDGSGPVDRIPPGIEAQKDFAYRRPETDLPIITPGEGLAQTEDDGDDELVTNEEDENLTFEKSSRDARSNIPVKDYFKFPLSARLEVSELPPIRHVDTPTKQSPPKKSRSTRRTHNRNISTNTILHNPVQPRNTKSSSSASPPKRRHIKQTPSGTGTQTPPKHSIYASSKPRPIVTNRTHFQSAPSRATLFNLDTRLEYSDQRKIRHRRSSMDMGLDITSDLGFSDQNFISAVPASFATQMAMATGMVKHIDGGNDGTERMMGRLMLARMKTLEEGLQEVVREFKEMRTQGNSPVDTGNDGRKDKDKGKKVVGRKERERPRSAAGKENIKQGSGETPEDRIIDVFLKKGSSY